MLERIYTQKYTAGVVSLPAPVWYALIMTTLPPDYPVSFDAPATYRIVVHGKLARSLSDRLEGMAINQAVGDDGTAVSVLVGELTDQSALAGVLYSLHELHMALITVEKIPPSGLPRQPA